MANNYKVSIKAEGNALMANFKELFKYKDLIILFVKRNFALIYKQTILGPAWLILTPLITSVVFTFVFGGLAGISTDGVPNVLFYMAGNIIWSLFSSAAIGIGNTFITNINLFSKVYFPRLSIPVSQAITAIMNFGIQFLMLVIFYVYFVLTGKSFKIGPEIAFLPVLIVHAALLAMAVGIIIASLTIKFRDLAIAITFVMQLWMYVTPIVYPMSITGGLMETLILINPMTAIVNNFRYVLLGCGKMLYANWCYSIVLTFILLFIGVKMYSKSEKNFVDTI